MRIHHLNCGTLRPLGRRLINGDGLPFQPALLVCHCLLIETDVALVLVDTGFGLGDIERQRHSPRRRRSFAGRLERLDESARIERARRRSARYLTRPRHDPDETALRQVARLGHAPGDVTDIVLTHLDGDHSGGLPDFPEAKVHLLQVEYDAAMDPATSLDRFRYPPEHWAHGPDWITYSSDGDRWFGFEAVRELQSLPDFALVPLPGHSRGHAGVAIRVGGADGNDAAGDRWLLHAGDAYFFHREMDPLTPSCTPGLARFQARFDVDRDARYRNQRRLRELVDAHGDQIEMFCSHDPVEFGATPAARGSARIPR